MRQILFRAWDKRSKIMRLFDSIFNKRPFTETSTFPQYDSSRECHELEIMQFAGRKDNCGADIYEDDIVQCFDGSSLIDIGQIVFGTFESSHEGGYSRAHFHIGFYVEKKGEQVFGACGEDLDLDQLVVIGNIHQHPELLK